MKKSLLVMAILSLGFMTSCSNDDDARIDNEEIIGEYSKGILVLNEGNFGQSNAEVTFIDPSLTSATQNLYQKVNGAVFGDTAQSMYEDDGLLYFVINNSNKIVVVQKHDFKKKAEVTTNLESPRYLVEKGNHLYVTNWGDSNDPNDDYVAVFDKKTLSLVTRIPVKEGPERIIESNNKIIVAHKGGWGTGNSVSFINPATQKVTQNIEVGEYPDGIAEANGTLYVLCSGSSWSQPSTSGKLVKINLNSETVTATLNFNDGENPAFLEKSNNQLYYTLGSSVYNFAPNATQLPSTPIFNTNVTTLYGFNVENGIFYVTDAKDYVSRGELKVFRPNGELMKSLETGIIPNSVMVLD